MLLTRRRRASRSARGQGLAQASNLFSVSGRNRSEPAFVAAAGALVTGVAFRATARRNKLSIYYLRTESNYRSLAYPPRLPMELGKGMWRGVGERALRGQYHVLESSSHPNLKKHCMDNAWTSRLSGNGTEGRVDNAATAV